MLEHPVNLIEVEFDDGEHFLSSYSLADGPDSGSGTIFVPLDQELPIGRSVIVHVRFGGLESEVMVRGYVAWRKGPSFWHRKRLKGAGVRLLAEERGKGDFLMRVASGALQDAVKRRHRRLPVDLPIAWHLKTTLAAGGRFQPGYLVDIGTHGAFVRGEGLPPVGSAVISKIDVHRQVTPFVIEGRVSWTRSFAAETGMGLRFRHPDAASIERLTDLLDDLERRYVRRIASVVTARSV